MAGAEARPTEIFLFLREMLAYAAREPDSAILTENRKQETENSTFPPYPSSFSGRSLLLNY